ncbi:MAG: lamin tail domain-containing protein [Planctomycetes bacterium]|nr:lamin tail domain-containing protein [Planctomycetota bacterium]
MIRRLLPSPFLPAAIAAAGILPLASAQQQVAPVQMPQYPPPDRVLVDDMWVPTEVLYGDGHWDGPSWTNGVVPYWFDDQTVSFGEKQAMLLAMAEIEAVCGVDFVPSTTGLPPLVLIRENPANTNVSTSEVGMQSLPQFLNIGAEHWDDHFLIVHELMHTLGFKHEHQRPDRDLYVQIQWSNIHPVQCGGGSCAGNFSIFNGQFVGPYDFDSVMHYAGTAFGVGSSTTIQCKPGFTQYQNTMGKLELMSYGDIQALQTKYGTPAGPAIASHVPAAVFAGVGETEFIFTGSGFNLGSENPSGIPGSRVQYFANGSWNDALETEVESSTRVSARIAIGAEFPLGFLPLRIVNDSLAGGATGTVLTAVSAVPCSSADERTGWAILGLPDTDNDGYDDVILGRPGYSNGRGQIMCRSGQDAALKWTVIGSPNGNLGHALALVGDVNGDGVADFACSEPGLGSGHVRIHSGDTGFVLRNIDGATFGSGPGFGTAIALAGDLDLNGVPDLVVGSPDYNNGLGRIDLVSGSSGGLFFGIGGLQPGERFGAAVSGGFDLDGDGRPEVAAGAPLFDGSNGIDCGRVSVYEGAFGTFLASAIGDGRRDQFGASVAIAPSTLAQATGSLLVGAPEPGTASTQPGTGYARLFRHVNGPFTGLLEIATWPGSLNGARRGHTVFAAGDVDDDGGTDFLVSSIGSATVEANVELVSGRTGEVLWRTVRPASTDDFGWALGVADRTNDGRLSALVGIPRSDGQCTDSGSWTSEPMAVAPSAARPMITEVATAVPGTSPAAIEITNFGTTAVDLGGWKVRFRDSLPVGNNGSGQSSSLAGIALAPLETIVLRTQIGAAFAETPPSVRTLNVLSGGPVLAADFAAALIAPNGYVVDEIHVAGFGGTYHEGSMGGKFGGAVPNHQTGQILSAQKVERIWGLDTNGPADWTVNGGRSMGLESQSSGARDPRTVSGGQSKVVLNEINRNTGHYVELVNRGSTSAQLQGWLLRYSNAQGAPIRQLSPFPEHFSLNAGDYMVIGSTAQPPAELPASVDYVRVNGLALGSAEFTLGLYDARGRLVDLVRATRPTTELVHNDPRLPGHPDAFRQAAISGSIVQSLGRSRDNADHDVGDDWHPMPLRTMGTQNPLIWSPDPEPGLDVRVNRRPGISAAMILDADPDRAGNAWSFLVSLGHANGQGPVLGLGPDAIPNWLFFSTVAPFYGVLDSHGAARVDLPMSFVPPGLPLDFRFLLIDPTTGAFVTLAPIVTYDS